MKQECIGVSFWGIYFTFTQARSQSQNFHGIPQVTKLIGEDKFKVFFNLSILLSLLHPSTHAQPWSLRSVQFLCVVLLSLMSL